jgi:hypothetical protein
MDNDNIITNTNSSNCTNGKNICSSNSVLESIKKYINKKDISHEQALNIAKEGLKCKTETCILTHPNFRNFVATKAPEIVEAINKDLHLKFKPPGPKFGVKLLNNFNIDNVLLSWAREFDDFHPCPFVMIDFDSYHNKFREINLAHLIEGTEFYVDPIYGKTSRVFNCFGCILNTDVSTGPGKHWVTIFVDLRGKKWTIEYFNSSGNPPCYEVVKWMIKQKKFLEKLNKDVEDVSVTNLVHQKSMTECGAYALYYIRARLEKNPYTYFATNYVHDGIVNKFRSHCFRSNF